MSYKKEILQRNRRCHRINQSLERKVQMSNSCCKPTTAPSENEEHWLQWNASLAHIPNFLVLQNLEIPNNSDIIQTLK
ncbi:hypothetical protein AVEN_31219-1, partial [Araneus ventricosus]